MDEKTPQSWEECYMWVTDSIKKLEKAVEKNTDTQNALMKEFSGFQGRAIGMSITVSILISTAAVLVAGVL